MLGASPSSLWKCWIHRLESKRNLGIPAGLLKPLEGLKVFFSFDSMEANEDDVEEEEEGKKKPNINTQISHICHVYHGGPAVV